MANSVDSSQLLDVGPGQYEETSPNERRRNEDHMSGVAVSASACCALCSRAYEVLDSVLPQSIYRLQVLRIVLAIILGLILIAVPILMQEVEPPGLSFTLFLFLYFTWAVVQNKLVRLSLLEPDPIEVNRTWAAMQYSQLDQGLGEHGGASPSGVTFNAWTIRRETRLNHPDVEVMHQQGVQRMPQREPITSCACCYNEFSPESAVALLQCGHVFCQDCIVALGREVSSQMPTPRFEDLKRHATGDWGLANAER